MPKELDPETKNILLKLQSDEITAHHVYRRIAQSAKGQNKEALLHISNDELRHYGVWKAYTKEDVLPRRAEIVKFSWLARIFGVTFAIKLLERGEVDAQTTYKAVIGRYAELPGIMKDEHRHEKVLMDMIKEERLEYIGSMVLGLNDALVELTGTLAGLTLAFQNSRIVGISGLIMGIAASLSMMSSEYLSKKSEGKTRDIGGKSPFKASVYTGIAYVFTVILLVMPFFLFGNIFVSLGVTVAAAIAIIAFFTYFTSVVHDESFKKRFLEMAGISLGVAAVSFLIGLLISQFLHIPAG
ncbi:MAG: VIT1/CCC1 transporter family protein [Nanoarchaeota archaeon]